jgi:hypothetical protein
MQRVGGRFIFCSPAGTFIPSVGFGPTASVRGEQ